MKSSRTVSADVDLFKPDRRIFASVLCEPVASLDKVYQVSATSSQDPKGIGCNAEGEDVADRTAASLQRILLVEDHPLFRAAFENLLRAFAPNAVILSAGTLKGIFEFIEKGEHIDCAFVDLDLPDAQEFEGLRKIGQAVPEMPIIVVSGLGNGLTRESCLEAGAFDVVPKSINQDEYFKLLPLILDAVSKVSRQESLDRSSLLERRFGLSPRQAQIAEFLIEGKRNGAIASELGITENTVKVHITKLLNALGVSSRAEATAVLLSDGVINRPSSAGSKTDE